MDHIANTMIAMGEQARVAARKLARASSAEKNRALANAASELLDREREILDANEKDMAQAKAKGLSDAMLDRLQLTKQRIRAMESGIEQIIQLKDPIGKITDSWTRPNGLSIQRVRVPLGVVGIIYESRPNVTADAGALCLKSGNAVILRGGSESHHSNHAIHACFVAALQKAGLPEHAIQMVPTTDRAAVGHLLANMSDYVDVIVPRGGKSLIARVQSDARVPVIGHLEGICHVYVHQGADLEMAVEIVVNAKMRRTGICGAAETLLIDKACLNSHLLPIVDALTESGCQVRGDIWACATDSRILPATDGDWDMEYLDAILSVRVVDDLDAAVDHITHHGSGHTEAIVTDDSKAAKQFGVLVDSAIVLHNASTQFADGGEFGMGAEIGIATGKVHARGPVGVEQLTSYKYLVHGDGQIRPL